MTDGGSRTRISRRARAGTAGRRVERLALERAVRLPASTATNELLPDPVRVVNPTASTRCRPRSIPRRSPWTDQQWAGRQLAGARDLRAAHRHVHRRSARSTRPSTGWTISSTSASTSSRCCPVNAFNGLANWGYDGVLWFAVDESYGGPDAYQRFVDACHRRRSRGDPGRRVQPPRARAATTCPCSARTCVTPSTNTWGASINFDEDEVRRYVIDNALMWLRDHHVDGLRLDAVHALVDHRLAAHPRRTGRCAGAARQRTRASADADRRVGPQRPGA